MKSSYSKQGKTEVFLVLAYVCVWSIDQPWSRDRGSLNMHLRNGVTLLVDLGEATQTILQEPPLC